MCKVFLSSASNHKFLEPHIDLDPDLDTDLDQDKDQDRDQHLGQDPNLKLYHLCFLVLIISSFYLALDSRPDLDSHPDLSPDQDLDLSHCLLSLVI